MKWIETRTARPVYCPERFRLLDGNLYISGILCPQWRYIPLEIADTLLCLFSADVSDDGDRYVVEVPRREIDTGSIESGETYRVALISADESEAASESSETTSTPSEPQPPVEAGEIRYVEIEDIGKQGDGIARVERGYVIIVPGGEIGERVKVEVSEVKSNFSVGEIIEDEF